MKRIALPLLLAFCSCGVAPARADDAATLARIEAKQVPSHGGYDDLSLEDIIRTTGVPGVSIAIVRDFRIVAVKSYGVADVATRASVDANTLFQAGSVSKPIAVVTALTLVQDGALSLDADVNTYLRSWRVPRDAVTTNEPVTLRSLFSHTSGADDSYGWPGYAPGAPLPTLAQILSGAAPANTRPVTFGRPPFAAQKYSGGGLVIAQLAMSDVTGKSLTQLALDRVFTPLDMKHSTYAQPLPGSLMGNAAHAHGRGARLDVPWMIYPEQAAAGLWTTPSDIAKVIIEIQQALRGRGRVLSQTTSRELVTPTGVGPFGVGLRIEKLGEGWYFTHSGDTRGFRARLIGHVRKGYGLAIMANSESADRVLAEIESRVVSAYGWDELDKPLPR